MPSNFIKPSEFFLNLQIKVNKCTTKFGKMSHIALCIVKYIYEKKANTFIYKYILENVNTFLLNV